VKYGKERALENNRKKTTKKQKKPENFEDALAKLEETAHQLESGTLGLEDAIQQYEQGISLAQYCQQKLSEAERTIEILQRNKTGEIKNNAIQVKDDTGEVCDGEEVQGSLL
jgi:exodeoxyribonuclease VII small subunit